MQNITVMRKFDLSQEIHSQQKEKYNPDGQIYLSADEIQAVNLINVA